MGLGKAMKSFYFISKLLPAKGTSLLLDMELDEEVPPLLVDVEAKESEEELNTKVPITIVTGKSPSNPHILGSDHDKRVPRSWKDYINELHLE